MHPHIPYKTRPALLSIEEWGESYRVCAGATLLLASVDDALTYAILRHRTGERLIGVVHDEANDARDGLAIVLVGCGERDLLALVGVGTLLRSVCLALEDGAPLCGDRGGLRDKLRAVNKAKDYRGGLCLAIILQLLLDVLPLRASSGTA